MYCANCGSLNDDPLCRVCGTTSGNVQAPAKPAYAGWWLRVGATVVDWIVLLIPSLGLFLIGDAVANSAAGTVLSTAIDAVYLIGMLSRPVGQTIGNRVVSTRVCDAVTGDSITFAQAVRRWLPYLLYSILQYAGTSAGTWTASVSLLAVVDILYPLMNDRKQTLHDRFAGTVVVRMT